MKILVTDGNSLPGLAITRSLGNAGHEVIVGYQKNQCLAFYSRFCTTKCIYPDPVSDSASFISFLLKYVEDNNIDAIFPVTDITTIPICKNKVSFEKFCKIPFGDFSTIDKTANKADVFQLASKLNIDIPESVIIKSPSDDELSNLKINYPVVIKPSRSRVLTDKGWTFTSVTYASDSEDLHKQLNLFKDEVFPVILQERINGPGLGIFLCIHNGKEIAAFSHKRIREKPPSGGVSVLRESITLDPLAYKFSKLLLSEINWQGVAMVEFKVDERDNRPKLMEINGRFWGSLQLAIDSGVNFPEILAETLTKESIAPITHYKIGVKARWFWGDVDALLIRFLKTNKKQNLADGANPRFIYLLNFLKFWEPGLHYDVMRWNDLRPWFYESYQWVRNFFK